MTKCYADCSPYKGVPHRINVVKKFIEQGLQNGILGKYATQNAIAETNNHELSKKEGCYIATLVYGDYEHPKVKILRRFRDDFLLTNYLGKNS